MPASSTHCSLQWRRALSLTPSHHYKRDDCAVGTCPQGPFKACEFLVSAEKQGLLFKDVLLLTASLPVVEDGGGVIGGRRPAMPRQSRCLGVASKMNFS